MNVMKPLLFVIIMLALVPYSGCSSSSDASLVTIQKMNDLYYQIDINMLGGSHYEVGRQYAQQIKTSVPDFDAQADAGINATVEMMRQYDPTITLEALVERARVILVNIPTDYQDEIRGMQSLFPDTGDMLGDGRLTQNELLVYELAPDVTRVVSCSASAAFGSATESGKTIVGRNLEWHDEILPFMADMQSVTMLHNGSSSIVYIGFVGQLYPVSGLNSSSIFASILDSDVGVPYVLDGAEHSYVMDLRYALENQTTLQGVADYLSDKDYAYDFDLFIADRDVAKVLEVDIHTPYAGLRTSTSALKTDSIVEILPWNFADAIACVNWFTLPDTIDNSDFWPGNAPRWSTFINLYGQYLAQGKITIDVMKQITGYAGATGSGKAITEGAIWRYDDGESEVQSIIMDMNTLETWVSFQPAGQAVLHSPNYIQIFSGNPF